MMRVAVGSANRVKVKAVESALEQMGIQAEVVGFDVESGVSNQPFSDEETIQGAVNRARAALKQEAGHISEFDFGIGLEGGVVDTPHGMFVCNWGAVVDRDGTVGIGGGHRVLLPEPIAEQLRKGEELGKVIDPFVGKHDIRSKEGTIGILTANHITRQSMFRDVVICAYARFMNPQLYK